MFLGLAMCVGLVMYVICQELSPESACSRFDFEEKTLHKLIRLEFTVEQTIQEMKTALSDMRSEVAIMQRERDSMKTEIGAIKRERDEMKGQIGSELKTQVDNFKVAQDSAIKRIQGLERDLIDLASTPTVWFLAKDPTDSSPATGQVIVYGMAVHNVGGGYSARSGKFTAPVQGLYGFTVHTCAYGSSSFHYLLRTNEYHLVQGRLYDSDGQFPCTSFTAYTPLEVGGSVWVTVSRGGSNKQIYTGDPASWSTFSGILVHT